MALPSSIQAILTRFRGTNNNAYNATSNSLGMGQGGHRQNFGPRLKDTADVVDWMSGAVDSVDADAQATAADRVQTGKDVTTTGQARDKAQAWANAPEDQEVEAGKFSAFHFLRKTIAQFNLAKAQADAAAASYDAFDDRYLGAKAADPTVDNDGNALIVGALYFSTSANVMKVWNGSAWQVQVPAAADYLARAGGTMTGLITFFASQFATQAQAEAGTDTAKLMTPQRVAQAIAARSPPSGLTLVSAQTVSSPVASVVFTGLDGTYDEYLLEALNVATDTNTRLNLRTSTNGGATFDGGSSDYRWVAYEVTTAGSSGTGTDNSTSISITPSTTPTPLVSNGGVSVSVKVIRPASATERKAFLFSAAFMRGSPGSPVMINGVGYRDSTADIDAVQFTFSAGNIMAGSFALYGLRKS